MLSVLTADDPAVADTRCVVVGVALVYFRSAITYRNGTWIGLEAMKFTQCTSII